MIPGRGNKIPHATRCGQKKKKKGKCQGQGSKQAATLGHVLRALRLQGAVQTQRQGPGKRGFFLVTLSVHKYELGIKASRCQAPEFTGPTPWAQR